VSQTIYLAENIKRLRLAAGLRQRQLAEKLFVSTQSVSKWEMGSSIPDLDNLCALAKIFDVSVDALLGQPRGEEKLLIGVDGGGTKTEFVLFDSEGHIRKRVVLGGSNPNVCGMDKCFETLQAGIDGFLSEHKVSAVYCGLAGFLSGSNGPTILAHLRKCYPDITVGCNGDILSVAASAHREDNCITAICGTGSIVCAVQNKSIRRVGGWGYLFDHKGSGYDIGRDAFTAALAERDGIGSKTLITDIIEKRLGSTVWDSINFIYSRGTSYIASFAGVVFDAAAAGDRLALEILQSNFKELAEKVRFASKLGGGTESLVIAGGVLHYRDVVLEQLHEHLGTMEIIVPELPQIYGASVLSRKQQGVLPQNFMQNFKTDYQKQISGE